MALAAVGGIAAVTGVIGAGAASAATAESSTPTARTVASISPDNTGWITVGTFGSWFNCDNFGIQNYASIQVPFRCVEINTGEPYFLWDLQVDLPGN